MQLSAAKGGKIQAHHQQSYIFSFLGATVLSNLSIGVIDLVVEIRKTDNITISLPVGTWVIEFQYNCTFFTFKVSIQQPGMIQ